MNNRTIIEFTNTISYRFFQSKQLRVYSILPENKKELVFSIRL